MKTIIKRNYFEQNSRNKNPEYLKRVVVSFPKAQEAVKQSIPIEVCRNLKQKKLKIRWGRVFATLFGTILISALILLSVHDLKNPNNPHNEFFSLNERKIKAIEEYNKVATARFKDDCWKAQHFKLAVSPACKEVLR